MRIHQFAFIAILILSQDLCFAQQQPVQSGEKTVLHKASVENALFVLKVDNRSLEIPESEDVNMETFDQNSIESISVLKDQTAVDTYGEKGRNGVVIIIFKDHSLLSKDLQRKFTEAEH